jgi:hypothetical protein
MRKVLLIALPLMFLLSRAAPEAQESQQKSDLKKCISSDGSVFNALSCPTTARVTKFEKAVVDEPGYTVEDYDTCIKRGKDWPESEAKEGLKKNCKQMADLGGFPGYHPGFKSPGFIVTFETPSAVYVVSAQAKCGNVKPDGTCDFSGGPGVIVGDTYKFTPPTGDSTVVILTETKDGTDYARLVGNMDSVTEKPAEKPKR